MNTADARNALRAARLPETLLAGLSQLSVGPFGKGVKEMWTRKEEFSSESAAVLAGLASDNQALQSLDSALDTHFTSTNKVGQAQEVIIGAGLHAAVYCAVRTEKAKQRKKTAEKPFILEASGRAGGSFALSRAPQFYLNSRNKPGKLGLPGSDGALNYLPGSMVQPADIGGAEYQTNTDLALPIRLMLAAHGYVLTNTRAIGIEKRQSGWYEVMIEGGRPILTKRIILARGLGEPNQNLFKEESDKVMTFGEFMRHMDTQPFPLRGMRRVAVIGGGDSGKTAVEALFGQGPSKHMSVASLDWVQRVEWYGANAASEKDWKACNRGRYAGIARFFRNTAEGTKRLQTREPASQISVGYERAYVDGRLYDLVINCTGFVRDKKFLTISTPQTYLVMGRPVGLKYKDEEIYQIGPDSQLPLEGFEASVVGSSIPENTAALFRYVDKTAMIANQLPLLTS